MVNDLIIVKAKIHFKHTQEGGRKSPVTSGYRPNHAFQRPADIRSIRTYISDIQFDEQPFIEPGETRMVTVRFLRISDIEQYINVGQRWFIYEVPRLVAEGEIVEVSS